jgi:hypothetical protein
MPLTIYILYCIDGYNPDQFTADQEDADMMNGNGYLDSDTIVGVQKKKSVLDDLPEHRGERAQVLLKNLPGEDLVHIVPEKIPAFLRVDKDVKNKRELLYDFYR